MWGSLHFGHLLRLALMVTGRLLRGGQEWRVWLCGEVEEGGGDGEGVAGHAGGGDGGGCRDGDVQGRRYRGGGEEREVYREGDLL